MISILNRNTFCITFIRIGTRKVAHIKLKIKLNDVFERLEKCSNQNLTYSNENV